MGAIESMEDERARTVSHTPVTEIPAPVGRYQDLFRALGYELEDAEAHSILVDEGFHLGVSTDRSHRKNPQVRVRLPVTMCKIAISTQAPMNATTMEPMIP